MPKTRKAAARRQAPYEASRGRTSAGEVSSRTTTSRPQSLRDIPYYDYEFHFLPERAENAEGLETGRFRLKSSHDTETPDMSWRTARRAIMRFAEPLMIAQKQWEDTVHKSPNDETSPETLRAWRQWTKSNVTMDINPVHVPEENDTSMAVIKFRMYEDPKEFDELSSTRDDKTVVRELPRLNTNDQGPFATIIVPHDRTDALRGHFYTTASDLASCRSALERALTASSQAQDEHDCTVCDGDEAVTHLVCHRLTALAQAIQYLQDEWGADVHLPDDGAQLLLSAVENTVASLKKTYPELSALSADVLWDARDIDDYLVWMNLIADQPDTSPASDNTQAVGQMTNPANSDGP